MFAKGTHALGICDRCGLTFRLNTLRELTIAQKPSGLLVCGECWEPDNPLLFMPVATVDSSALRRPRPDNKRAPGLVVIDWGWNPVFSPQLTSGLGGVTVVINQ